MFLDHRGHSSKVGNIIFFLSLTDLDFEVEFKIYSSNIILKYQLRTFKRKSVRFRNVYVKRNKYIIMVKIIKLLMYMLRACIDLPEWCVHLKFSFFLF